MKLLTIAKPWMIVVSLAGFITTSSAASILLDLSKDFEESPSINRSPGAVAVLNAAKALPNIRTLMVLEDGEIVASYARDNVDSNEPYQIHSVTKSITSLLMGILIDDGAISLNETLGQIFTNETTWQDIEDADYRKNITIREMLTMTSGLQFSWSDLTSEWIEDFCGSNTGEERLRHWLGDPIIGTKGQFEYLLVNDILSYAIVERTGMTPREVFATRVLPYLGIEDIEIGWKSDCASANPNPTSEPEIEPAFNGLFLTPVQMAKIGMLYMQEGAAGPDIIVVSPAWVDATFTPQVIIGDTFAYDTPWSGTPIPYGYLWYQENAESWSAQGFGGQVIAIHTQLRRVFVHQRDDDAPEDTMETVGITAIALDPSLAFQVPVNSSAPSTAPVDSAAVNSRFMRLLTPVVFQLMVFVFLH